jgi:pimeloyl-ACP methyl ester carboxylesterase
MKLKNTLLFIFIVTLFTPHCFAQGNQVAYGNNPSAGHYANVNGIKMYYEIYGKGQPLLLIHGDGGTIKEERNQIAFFSKYYRVIEADSRGQGKTNDNSDSLTYSLMAEDFNAFLNYLHLDSVFIFGQSDGAIIGLLLAARHPEKVKMLAAMSPNLRPDDSVFYPKVAALDHKWYDKTQQELDADKPGSVAEMKLERLMTYHPHISDSELQTIKAPVLIMTADRDEIRLSHIIEIFRAIPKANLCVLPGSIHFALLQNPGLFNYILYHFYTSPFKMPDTYDTLLKMFNGTE